LYKYGFNREINAAEQRQREGSHIPVREIERRSFHDQVRGLSQELENERQRNKTGCPHCDHGGQRRARVSTLRRCISRS
jgi:hypothetical protein